MWVYNNKSIDFVKFTHIITQCSPYQVVTGKIYCLKQHFLLPAATVVFTEKLINKR